MYLDRDAKALLKLLASNWDMTSEAAARGLNWRDPAGLDSRWQPRGAATLASTDVGGRV